MLVDTHCHLNFAAFEADREAVLARAVGAGVERIVVVGTTLADSAAAVELAERHRGRVYCTVGIHPHEAATLDGAALAELRRLADRPGVVAIGETGLDLYRNRCPRELQERALRAQLGLARELGLPVVLHTRAALCEVARVLDETDGWALRPVAHCFTTDPEQARHYLERGAWVSLGGPVTYPKAAEAREVAALAPAGRLMLETDAPYLAPQSRRGQRCEPADVAEIATAVAAARGEPREALVAATGAAAAALFGW